MPIALSRDLLERPGWIGPGLAALLLAASGCLGLRRRPGQAWPANLGAMLVGCSQFWPVLQLLAGFGGIMATRLVLDPLAGPSGPRLGLVGGFLATALTGLILLLISLVPGNLVVAMFRPAFPEWGRQPKSSGQSPWDELA